MADFSEIERPMIAYRQGGSWDWKSDKNGADGYFFSNSRRVSLLGRCNRAFTRIMHLFSFNRACTAHYMFDTLEGQYHVIENKEHSVLLR